MIYTIKRYDSNLDFHVLISENGESINADIMVSGDLEAEEGSYIQYCKGIVGERIEVEKMTPFISLGHGVKLL